MADKQSQGQVCPVLYDQSSRFKAWRWFSVLNLHLVDVQWKWNKELTGRHYNSKRPGRPLMTTKVDYHRILSK